MNPRRIVWSALTTVLLASALPLSAQHKPKLAAQVSSGETVSFEVLLPQEHRDRIEALLEDLQNPQSPNYRHWLTPSQYESRFGADPNTLAGITRQLKSLGLQVSSLSSHALVVSGPASAAQAALGTPFLHAITAKGRATIVAAKPISLAGPLASASASIAGLSGMERMHVHSRRQAAPANFLSPWGPYLGVDLKQAYDWPSYKDASGKGVTIAVLCDGAFKQSDMDSYFHLNGLDSPKIKLVQVDGGAPYDPSSEGTFETELDIQQAGAMAPRATILDYSIPSLSDLSIYDGLIWILLDNKADVVNMSFGSPELAYTAAYSGVDETPLLGLFDDMLAQGALQGITFVVSSGDGGAVPLPEPACFDPSTTAVPCGHFLASAEFPASSPHVVAVGGTNLTTVSKSSPSGGMSYDSSYVSEAAYADPLAYDIFYGTTATGGVWGSGGGSSIYFARPSYQTLVKTGSNTRTVPDVALHMGGCPGGSASCDATDDYGDFEVLGGVLYGAIGTSAAAPDFAGLVAVGDEYNGSRLGNGNYILYPEAAAQGPGLKFFHTKIPGYNGLFTSGSAGYNRVVGNGTLFGQMFIGDLSGKAAGNPGSGTNP